jgi:hypothetical protein
MPDECKIGKDVVASYRNYYKVAKKDFLTFKKRNNPYWLK